MVRLLGRAVCVLLALLAGSGVVAHAQQLEEMGNLDAMNEGEETPSAAERGGAPGEGGTTGGSGGAALGRRQAPRQEPSTAAPAAVETNPARARPRVELETPRRLVFSFGLMAGQPTGVQAQARLFNRNAFVASLGYDFIFRGLNATVDYRFTVYNLEMLRYDLLLGFWVGAGARVAALEPYRPYQRNFRGFGFGGRLPVGVTLRLRPLPVEFGAYISPLGVDFNGLMRPRWRPEAGVEMRIDFPYSPW